MLLQAQSSNTFLWYSEVLKKDTLHGVLLKSIHNGSDDKLSILLCKDENSFRWLYQNGFAKTIL